MTVQIWECKIGGLETGLPDGADWPMREAIRCAYFELTGEWPEFIFSGWGASLTQVEEEIVAEKSGT